MTVESDTGGFTVRELDASSWDAFAELVERNGGIFGGCWCIGFHPECGQPGINHRRVYEQDAPPLPDRRITCFYVDKHHRGQGIARDAQGRFLYSATVELFEDHGFERVRQVGKHAWIVSKVVRPRRSTRAR